ncbi:histidine phosphatase family protein, partial [Bradyrhizobium sp. 62]
MRRLLLLRHAKTETDAPSGRDQDRRLDDRGHKDAAEIGDWMASHPPFPEAVLVSHAVRARQTWDIAWETMKDRVAAPQVEILPELYAADPAQILESIRTATVPADPKQLLVVGHNPGMH